MVNHLRSLILNRRRPSTNLPPWDRYMDPSFSPVELTSNLEEVRTALIGSSDDWWTLTLRAEAVLSAVSSERYAGRHLWYDNRETSMPVEPFYVDFANTLTSLSSEADQADGSLVVTITDKPIDVYRRWVLRILSADYLTVQEGGTSYTAEFAPTAKISDDIALSVNDKTIGAEWELVSVTKPINWLRVVFNNLSNISDAAVEELLVGEDPVERAEMGTYRLWSRKSPFSADKLAAIVFAYNRKVTALM